MSGMDTRNTPRSWGYGKQLPILYRNIIDGLPNDAAAEAFLWAAEHSDVRSDPHLYRAEAFAREHVRLLTVVPVLCELSRRTGKWPREVAISDAALDNLVRYIVVRHCNMFAPNTRMPDFLAEPT